MRLGGNVIPVKLPQMTSLGVVIPPYKKASRARLKIDFSQALHGL